MSELVIFFSAVPDAIWGALIASILTLSGVFFTNKENRKSLERQLTHDVEKVRIERDYDLKKDVFLEAAYSFSKTISTITKLGNIETPVADIAKDFDDHSPIVSKIYLIAQEETVEHALYISNEMSRVYLDLLTSRKKFQDARNSIDIHRRIIKKSETEKDRVLETMKELNLGGYKEKSKFDYLSGLFDSAEKSRIEAEKNIIDLEEKHHNEYMLFVKRCVKEYSELSVKMSGLIISVRSELNTANDNQHFSSIIKKSMDEMTKNFDKYLNDQRR